MTLAVVRAMALVNVLIIKMVPALSDATIVATIPEYKPYTGLTPANCAYAMPSGILNKPVANPEMMLGTSPVRCGFASAAMISYPCKSFDWRSVTLSGQDPCLFMISNEACATALYAKIYFTARWLSLELLPAQPSA
jgi:hypothetical protein